MQSANNKSFLSLIRLGVGHRADIISDLIDWPVIQALAEQHGLYAFVIDGIEMLPEGNRPPQEQLLEWIGAVLQGYEYRFDSYCRTMAEMAKLYREYGFKMMILKGYACGIDWPKPEHRPYGDIDIWLFGCQKQADAFVAKEKGIKIDNSHHHHTVFEWGEFTVENHYDFINVYGHKSSAELEKVFKELGNDDNYTVEVLGEKIYLPSPNLHALFLIKHLTSHFVGANITLRQVLDWAFFVEKHTKEVDWKWVVEQLDKYHMKDFFNLINAICVDDLGFRTDIFPTVQFLPDLKEKVLADILEPAFGASEPKCIVPRLIYKYRRWQGNAWKQNLCYSESRWNIFWRGIWAKMLKPASF